MTNEAYHSRSEISKSSIDLFMKSPYHYKHRDELRKESKAFELGSAVHTLVLEPHKFESEYIVQKIDKRTVAGRELVKEAIEKRKTILSPEDYEIALEMSKSVLSSKVGKLLGGGIAEASYFSEIDGIGVRCRPDYYNEDLGIIIDLKTTVDASPSEFAKSCGKFNYHIQDAFYTDVMNSLGKKVSTFLFIGVEKTAPYMVGAYVLSDVDKDLGREQYKKVIEKIKICEGNNDFGEKEYFSIDATTGAKDYVQTIVLPNYVHYKEI